MKIEFKRDGRVLVGGEYIGHITRHPRSTTSRYVFTWTGECAADRVKWIREMNLPPALWAERHSCLKEMARQYITKERAAVMVKANKERRRLNAAKPPKSAKERADLARLGAVLDAIWNGG